jgi:hypothetical protein
VYKGKFKARETPETRRLMKRRNPGREALMNGLELLCFIKNRSIGVLSLHSQEMVIALFIVEHGSREVVKDVVNGEWTISLVCVGKLKGD